MKNKIKEVRKSKGITQKELAEMLGIKPPTLSQIENGNNAKVETLEKIAKALDCKLFDLMGIEPPKMGEILEIKAENGKITEINRLTGKDAADAKDQVKKDAEYIKQLAVPALKLNDLGRKLLLDNAETMAANTELIRNNGK